MNEKLNYSNFKDFVGSRKLILFGASMSGVEAINSTGGSVNISYLCDNDVQKHGKSLLGINIEPPAKLEGENRENTVILISSTYFDEIREQLIKMGFSLIIDHDHIWDATQAGDNASDRTNVVGKAFHIDSDDKETLSKIDKLFNLIEDDKYSKELLSFVIENRIKREALDWSFIFSNCINSTPYFSNELFGSISDNEIIIDGGLESCGDFKHFYRVLGSRLKKFYGFDPDKSAFKTIKATLPEIQVFDYCEKIKRPITDIFEINVLPYALSDKSGVAYMDNSIVSEIGDPENAVSAKSIDETIAPGEKITLIKLDIEGAEIKALKGAVRTITTHRPRLAVCLYHKPEDLWEIPFFIKELCPEYKLYIRPHGGHKSVLEVHAVI